jgi:hypothetical protein
MNLVTDATSMPNQTSHPGDAHPLYIPLTAEQSHESQEFIDPQNLQYSFPFFTPPSWSFSHQLEIYPDSLEFYPQSLPYPMPIQLGFEASSPLPWMESQMPNHEVLPPWINGLSNSGPSPCIWPAEGYSPFDTDLQMVN